MPVFSAGVDGRVRFLVEVHLQLSGMACGMGNRCPRALKEPDLNCLSLVFAVFDYSSALGLHKLPQESRRTFLPLLL